MSEIPMTEEEVEIYVTRVLGELRGLSNGDSFAVLGVALTCLIRDCDGEAGRFALVRAAVRRLLDDAVYFEGGVS